jgi:hypothetical protein
VHDDQKSQNNAWIGISEKGIDQLWHRAFLKHFRGKNSESENKNIDDQRCGDICRPWLAFYCFLVGKGDIFGAKFLLEQNVSDDRR